MIRLDRLPEPQILRDRGLRWTEQFLGSTEPRPRSDRYRHREIVRTLRAISAGKCFYCEQAVAERDGEVDHHVEVHRDRALAFAWANLYWSCRGCNDKLPESTVPATDCLDPFDPEIDPVDHLAYDDEKIVPRGDSTRGRQTIRKYQLDRSELDLARIRALRELDGRLRRLHQRGIPFDAPEVVALREAFAARDRPFSAMFAALLARADW